MEYGSSNGHFRIPSRGCCRLCLRTGNGHHDQKSQESGLTASRDVSFPPFCLWRNHSSHRVPAAPGKPATGGWKHSRLLILGAGTPRLEGATWPRPTEMQGLLCCFFFEAPRTHHAELPSREPASASVCLPSRPPSRPLSSSVLLSASGGSQTYNNVNPEKPRGQHSG